MYVLSQWPHIKCEKPENSFLATRVDFSLGPEGSAVHPSLTIAGSNMAISK